jgi:uncharacterized protein (TIGR02599 family)
MRRYLVTMARREKRAFTLVEILVAMAVLVIILGLLLAITSTVSKTVLYTSSKMDAFATGRAGFDLMSQKLSQATLNTYWDYDNPVAPQRYYRQSDMQFLVRQNTQASGYGQEVYFATPSTYSASSSLRSTDGLLNSCSFYVEYISDAPFRPSVFPSSGGPAKHYRYRLVQGLEPTENYSMSANWPTPPSSSATSLQWTTYWTSNTSGNWPYFWTSSNPNFWINTVKNLGVTGNGTTSQLGSSDTPLADNVIALIVWPRLNLVDDATGNKLTTNYTYDSQNPSGFPAMTINATTGTQYLTANQLPPTIQVTMIVISAASATRLDNGSGTPPTVIESALSGKFTKSDTTDYAADIASVSTALSTANIAFQVLNTTITMKESKWSDYSQ